MTMKKAGARTAAKPDKVNAGSALGPFFAALEHPLKAEIEQVRKTILGADQAIGEGIKWNSVSFKTTEFFATVHLRSTKEVQLVFHLGAKVRTDGVEVKISDPEGMIKWLAKDRGLVTVGAGKVATAKQAALKHIVRQWIAYV
jgi:hypothetical protein